MSISVRGMRPQIGVGRSRRARRQADLQDELARVQGGAARSDRDRSRPAPCGGRRARRSRRSPGPRPGPARCRRPARRCRGCRPSRRGPAPGSSRSGWPPRPRPATPGQSADARRASIPGVAAPMTKPPPSWRMPMASGMRFRSTISPAGSRPERNCTSRSVPPLSGLAPRAAGEQCRRRLLGAGWRDEFDARQRTSLGDRAPIANLASPRAAWRELSVIAIGILQHRHSIAPIGLRTSANMSFLSAAWTPRFPGRPAARSQTA